MKSDRKILYHTDGDYVPLEELERLEKDLSEIKASHKRQCDLNDKAWERVKKLEQLVSWADSAILEYLDHKDPIVAAWIKIKAESHS